MNGGSNREETQMTEKDIPVMAAEILSWMTRPMSATEQHLFQRLATRHPDVFTFTLGPGPSMQERMEKALRDDLLKTQSQTKVQSKT